MSTTAIVIIVLLILGVNAVFFWLLSQKLAESKKPEDESGLKLLLQQMNELTRTVDNKLIESSRQMTDSLHKTGETTTRIVQDITERLTRLDETNKQVISFADQLQSLQDILKNPKQRGVLGEYYLETLLKNVMPPGSFQMQYKFGDGEIVDAVVFVKDKIIPIDSKFSLENYNRLVEEKNETVKAQLEKTFVNDLKERIVETSKYIRPAEGTMDFAFMFIPHEAIYYDLLINKVGALEGNTENLIHRAAGKYKVIIVSPTSFLAYLQTVLQGLKAMQIEDKVVDVIKRVGELGKHLKGYEEYHSKMGNALGTVVNHYNSTNKEFKKIDKDVLRITGEGVEIETMLIEGPEKDVE
ncbi:MAG: DNA recombination protein RmuC [bacterium]|nr:DNA recombination protein RmuC [bacterium]